MTIKTAIDSASLRVIGTVSPAVFSSTDQAMVELRNLAQDVAEMIAKSHDWRALTQIGSFSGDGVTESFPKPAGYDRMVTASSVSDPQSWFWGYFQISTVNEWLMRKRTAWISPGGWIIIGGNFNFWPAPHGLAEFPFISNHIAVSEDGQTKARFDADTDSFVLPERLLTLGLIWRYRAQKGLDYGEDMANYNIALSEEQAADPGARVIRKQGYRPVWGARTAWPWPLGGL